MNIRTARQNAFFIIAIALLILSGSFLWCFADDASAAAWNLHYQLTDLEGNTVSTANPAKGGEAAKYKILIFGRVGCGNTAYTLSSIAGSSWVSDTDIEVMFVEEGNTTEELMQGFVDQNCCSDMIICPTQNGYGGELLWDYYEACVGETSSVTLPVIVIIDENDLIRGMTTGAVSADVLLSECSYFCDGQPDVLPETPPAPEILKLDAVCGQSEARSMLDEMNARRTGSSGTDPWYWDSDDSTKITVSGLEPLIYDYSLEKVAMQRAAEIALSYSHTRPNGDSCFSAYYEFDNVGDPAGENIAVGFATAQDVLDAWWEEDERYDGQGHRRNILGIGNGSSYVGIGHVNVGGVDYWVQEFTRTGSGDGLTTANDSVCTFDVEYFSSNIISDTMDIRSDSYTDYETYWGRTITVTKGSTHALPEVEEMINYKGGGWGYGCAVTNSSEWVITDTSIAEISGGAIIAKAAGSTTLSRAATYGGDPLEISIIVTEPEPQEESPDQGGSSDGGYPWEYEFDSEAADPGSSDGEQSKPAGTGDPESYDGEKSEQSGTRDIRNTDIELGQLKYTYNGKARKPQVYAHDGSRFLFLNEDYTVKYSKNTKVGTASVVIRGIGDYSGTITKTFRIVPKKTSISSLKAQKKGFTVKWKTQKSQASGYQIRYSLKSSMKGAGTVTIKSSRTGSKKIKSLKAKKKYYVQIRTYKTVNGKKYYSAWSAKKKVKTM